VRVLGIDPGNVESAYVLLDDNLKPVRFGKVKNEELSDMIYRGLSDECTGVAIEMIASYGMAVGETIFDTCVWIGRFTEQVINESGITPTYIYRKDEKMNLCHTMKAKDSNIRQALIDRFGIVGKKASPGFFYGFKSDIWAAMAVGVTYYDMYVAKEQTCQGSI